MPSAKYISTKHQAMQEGDTVTWSQAWGQIYEYLYLSVFKYYFEYLYFEVLKQHVFVFKYFVQKLKILSANNSNTLLLKFLNK